MHRRLFATCEVHCKVARRDTGQQPQLRQSCHISRSRVQFSHARSVPHPQCCPKTSFAASSQPGWTTATLYCAVHRQRPSTSCSGPKILWHLVDPPDSIQTITAVTALVASAGVHWLQGGAPRLQGADDVDTTVSGFAAVQTHQHTFTAVDRCAESCRPENTYWTRSPRFFCFSPIRLEWPPWQHSTL